MRRNSTTRWSETLSAARPGGTGGSRPWSATSPASTETSHARYNNLRSPPASSDRTGTIALRPSSASSSQASSERSLVSATMTWSPADQPQAESEGQYRLTASRSSSDDGSRSMSWRVPQLARYKKASKYRAIRSRGSPLKSPQSYVLTKDVGVIRARVDNARNS